MALKVSAPRDFAAGIAFLFLGSAFFSQALGLRIGTARSMGPGYFPMLLSAGLILTGLVLSVRSLRIVGEKIEPVSGGKLAAVTLAICTYAVTVQGAGFVPAIFVLVAISAFANSEARPLPTILTGLGLALGNWAVFTKGLNLNLPAFGPWLGF